MLKTRFTSISYTVVALFFGTLAIIDKSEILDVALKEVYFSIPKSFVWIILAFIFLIFAGISLAFELSGKQMNPYLFAAHFLLTIAGLGVIYFTVPQQVSTSTYTEYSLANEPEVSENSINTVQLTSWMIYTVIGAQIVFVLNMLVSILKSRKAKRTKL